MQADKENEEVPARKGNLVRLSTSRAGLSAAAQKAALPILWRLRHSHAMQHCAPLLLCRLPKVTRMPKETIKMRYLWQNGHWHCR